MRTNLTQDETDQLRTLLALGGVRQAARGARSHIPEDRWPPARRLLIQESASGGAREGWALVDLRSWPEGHDTVSQETLEIALDGAETAWHGPGKSS